MTESIHNITAQGGWFEKDLCEQMGNIGSEVGRAVNWQKKGNTVQQKKALDRAFDLLDLTMADTRWHSGARLKEICRARGLLADIFYGKNEFNDSPADLEKYFYQFALMARLKK